MLDERALQKLAEQGIDEAQVREALKAFFLLLHQVDARYATIVRDGSRCNLTIGWHPFPTNLPARPAPAATGDDDDDEDFDDDDDDWLDDDDDQEWIEEQPWYETQALRYLAETWQEVQR